MGNILPELYLRYSFSILSFAEHLLFLSNFIHLRISLSVMDELRISSSSLVSMLEKFASSSCMPVLSLRFLKKLNKVSKSISFPSFFFSHFYSLFSKNLWDFYFLAT